MAAGLLVVCTFATIQTASASQESAFRYKTAAIHSNRSEDELALALALQQQARKNVEEAKAALRAAGPTEFDAYEDAARYETFCRDAVKEFAPAEWAAWEAALNAHASNANALTETTLGAATVALERAAPVAHGVWKDSFDQSNFAARELKLTAPDEWSVMQAAVATLTSARKTVERQLTKQYDIR